MIRRFKIIKNTLVERTFGGSIKDWFFNTFSPSCEILSKIKISKIDTDENFHFIWLSGHAFPVVLSKNISIHSVNQVIAEQFYKWNWHYYQVPETVVDNKDVVFDCGSAEGIFSLIAWANCKKVYAFEPLEEYLDGLNRTFKAIENVVIVNEALGDRIGSAYFAKKGISSQISNTETDNKVKLNTIDNFCHSHKTVVNYIKADIEGFEINLLHGGENSIRSYKPKIAITVYHPENNVKEIRKYLIKLVPEYKFKVKGVSELANHPVMLHAWV
jgi:FkbM family methyltransferase